MDIVDYTYHPDGSVTVEYADGSIETVKQSDSGTGSSSGSSSGSGSIPGWLSALLGALPGLIAGVGSLFGKGGSEPQSPVVTTTPGTPTTVNLGGSNTNSILLIALVVMFAYIVFTGKQPKK
ncbi:hypothetical protein [Dyadobacter sediminis]|uniref:Uncharacterized protein n=1 Tax=Dyadobacter sediminis TaxID=1493691 RepID=A0A5R9KB57_9BACT|nr:hypothetical protein [Dyadobacter sediminis]TLU91992.1 hypothetical protein FEM55_14625 [Dyadobacter sediminis]GGB98416.1 hypothetical protein GCM10011325_27120 [Dyadobacter sediminis]